MSCVYDAENVKVGDVIYLADMGGWGTPRVSRWTVEKVTPAKQAVIKNKHGAVERLTPRGSIVGEGSYGSRRIVSEADAMQYAEQGKIDDLWRSAGAAAQDAASACRQRTHNLDKLNYAVVRLSGAAAAIAKYKEQKK